MNDSTVPEDRDENALPASAKRGEAHAVSDETLARHLLPLLEVYDVKWRGHGVIYVDDTSWNIESATRLIAELGMRLGLPAEIVRRRLIEANLLRDVRRQPMPGNPAQRVVAQLAASKLLNQAPRRGEPEDPDQN